MTTNRRCLCGSPQPYDECCGPLHGGEPAPTAEALMRSRFSAFVLGDARYLLRTWHPDTRPARLDLDPDRRWRWLEILATEGGSLFDPAGTVEFRAEHQDGTQHERSRFRREHGEWRYLDGIVNPPPGGSGSRSAGPRRTR